MTLFLVEYDYKRKKNQSKDIGIGILGIEDTNRNEEIWREVA